MLQLNLSLRGRTTGKLQMIGSYFVRVWLSPYRLERNQSYHVLLSFVQGRRSLMVAST